MAESESRFEVLEEETHYPATHPKSAESAEKAQDETKEEETLEQQLERLVLSAKKDESEEGEDAKDAGDNVKKASAAKELGNNNRAACLLRLGRTEESVDDCTQAVTLSPTYVKALLRRAEALEKLDKLEEALADYDAVLKIDPTVRTAVKGHERLQKIVHERQEKMKAEMLEKLKGFGNTILGKFGLSTDNFQMVQDPATGSYSINFQQNPGQPGQPQQK
ncbi:unnamed protein product [Phytophthora lilii]|uniref:Unnamed protein product n=1 Tax=Phytophthora lilii TaxID=2077276 RepID=A0A9W6UBJ5_9STRA|nr:unnamed protein product [Phytophthora lilii]